MASRQTVHEQGNAIARLPTGRDILMQHHLVAVLKRDPMLPGGVDRKSLWCPDPRQGLTMPTLQEPGRFEGRD